jgi:hypothetical protein
MDMKILLTLTKVVVFLMLPLSAVAEPIFEGYYRLSLADAPIGYFIQRYDLNQKDKTFTSTYYLYTKTADGTTTESLNAKASEKLEPLSFQYTMLEGKKTKVIDAFVKGKKLVMKIVENGKTTAKEIPMTNDTFFSTFLSHLMLRNPKGMQVGNKFTYTAIAEEDGMAYKGEAFVKEQVKERGFDTFRTLNTFKKQEFVNWVNFKGEALKTQVPAVALSAELVADPKDAYKNMDFNQASIKLLFGGIPEGKINMLNKK